MAGGQEEAEEPSVERPDKAGALGGPFWGILFGLLFFVPSSVLGVGAAAGAIGGKLVDVGVDDDFIAEVARRSPRARRPCSC